MKIKKMKLLSLFFVIASTVAVKTSFNPVCVQAMEAAQPNFSYGFADIDELKDVKFITYDKFNESVAASIQNAQENNQDLVFSCTINDDDDNKKNDDYYFTHLYKNPNNLNNNAVHVVKDSDDIAFEFKINNKVVARINTTIQNISGIGALLLCRWINNSLPNKIKSSIGFDNWDRSQRERFKFVSTKLGEYFYNNMKEKINFNPSKAFHGNLIFSVDFNAFSSSLHCFYEMRVNDEKKLAYLGSFKFSDHEVYDDLNKALNSCLFHCGYLNGYSDSNKRYEF